MSIGGLIMKQYTVNTVTIARGETIAYRKTGDGKNQVLLIHGNMSSSVHWQTTMEDLEKDFTVYAPDMRGFGDSSYNAHFDSLQCLAEDLSEFIDLVGLDNFTVIGWSTGGGVALELAALRPEVVKKVITLGSVPITGYPIYKKDENGAPILTELVKTKAEIANDPVQVVPILKANEDNNRDFIRLVLNNSMYIKNKPNDDDYEAYIDAVIQQRCLVDTNYSLLTFNMTDAPSLSADGSNRLELVKCPIVMLQGTDDPLVPLDWGRQSHETIGDKASFVLLNDLGHSPMTDDFATFIAAVRKEL